METTTTYDWTAIIRQYELITWCGYYNARADVERRRRENGDDEAARWFERVGSGERLTWNTKADWVELARDFDNLETWE